MIYLALNAYRVKGSIPMGRKRTTFTIETASADEDAARESVLSTVGSRHRVKRRAIKIEDVTQIGADEVSNPVIEHRLEVGA